MGLWQTIRGWFTYPPPKVRVLVVAPGREVFTVLRGLPAPIVHQTEQDASVSYWGVFIFEAANGRAMVAILHGDGRETHVELVGMGREGDKGELPAAGLRLLQKQFPVVALDQV